MCVIKRNCGNTFIVWFWIAISTWSMYVTAIKWNSFLFLSFHHLIHSTDTTILNEYSKWITPFTIYGSKYNWRTLTKTKTISKHTIIILRFNWITNRITLIFPRNENISSEFCIMPWNIIWISLDWNWLLVSNLSYASWDSFNWYSLHLDKKEKKNIWKHWKFQTHRTSANKKTLFFFWTYI